MRRLCSSVSLVAVLGLATSVAGAGAALAATPQTTTTKLASSVISTPAAVTATLASTPPAPVAIAPVPSQTETTVAAFKDGRWNASITVYRSPGGRVLTRIKNGVSIKGRVVFTVIATSGDWLKVNVPVRPNGLVGYVRAADVTTFTHKFAVVIELAKKQIYVYQGTTLVHTEKVAIGKAKTPTPTGKFFTVDLIRPKGGPNGPYGAYAYGLSGFSNVYQRFGGGDGRLGIHGTNNPKALGTAISAGCIRMTNAGITKLRNVLPLGVPVEIRK